MRSLRSAARVVSRGPICALAIAFLGGCFVPEQGVYDQVLRFWERQNYFQAYQELERVRAEYPDDPEGERIHEFVRRDWLLWKARNAIFANEEVEALGLLEQVLTRDPEDGEALGLRSKARQKLAIDRVEEAQELQVSELDDDLRVAFRLYNEALSYDPGNVEAEEGLAEVDAIWAKRRETAEDRRLRGIRNLADGHAARAAYEFEIALDEDPRMDSIENAYAQARREMAEEEYVFGQRAQESGQWDSAKRIYAKLLDADARLEGLEDRLAYVTKEAEARRLFQAAEVAIFQARFTEAKELLAQASELSEVQRADIAIAELLVSEKDAEIRAAMARDQDLQGELQRALEIYLEIRDIAPAHLDLEARIHDLQIRIDEATQAYDAGRKAEAVGDNAEAISQYGFVELFWPGYQDAAERKAALEAAAAGAGSEPTSGQTSGDSGETSGDTTKPVEAAETPAGEPESAATGDGPPGPESTEPRPTAPGPTEPMPEDRPARIAPIPLVPSQQASQGGPAPVEEPATSEPASEPAVTNTPTGGGL